MASSNLVSLKDRTKEEKHAIAVKGGIASGKARRLKKSMKDILEIMLEQTYKDSGKTFQELVTLGLIDGAIKGNPLNYKTIMETLGEQAKEEGTNGIINDLVEALNNVKKD